VVEDHSFSEHNKGIALCASYMHDGHECFTVFWISPRTSLQNTRSPKKSNLTSPRSIAEGRNGFIQRYDGRGDKNQDEQKAIDTAFEIFFAENMSGYEYHPVTGESFQLPHPTRLEVINSNIDSKTTDYESKSSEEKKLIKVIWDPFDQLYPFMYIKLRRDGMSHEDASEELTKNAYLDEGMVKEVEKFIRNIMVILRTRAPIN
jgi:hypothetical protein